MRTGRPKATLKLNEDEKRELTSLAHRSRSAPALAHRARIVLACAEGDDNQAVARKLRVTPATVGKWRNRFVQDRLEGLYDEPRPGAPCTITDEHRTLALNIRGDGRHDVRRYIESTGQPARLFAFMSPSTQGSQSIGGSEDACAFAQLVRDRMGQLAKADSLQRTRLFFYGPLALAVFLGQQLTAVGEIQLFEYQDPGYIPSCSLRT
jgi:DNA-binding CsgD family transcriptional regulator